MPKPIVYIIDDDEAVRDSLTTLFGSVKLSSKALSSAMDFHEVYEPDRPGCLLLDVRMPGMSGLQLQEELAARSIDLPIIILTGHADVPTVIRAMKEGAADFMDKPVPPQILIDRVNELLKQSTENLAKQKTRHEFRRRLASLSHRERQVLDLIMDGAPNKRIAFELGVSERTVEAHRSHLMEKMQAHNLVELVLEVKEADVARDSSALS